MTILLYILREPTVPRTPLPYYQHLLQELQEPTTGTYGSPYAPPLLSAPFTGTYGSPYAPPLLSAPFTGTYYRNLLQEPTTGTYYRNLRFPVRPSLLQKSTIRLSKYIIFTKYLKPSVPIVREGRTGNRRFL